MPDNENVNVDSLKNAFLEQNEELFDELAAKLLCEHEFAIRRNSSDNTQQEAVCSKCGLFYKDFLEKVAKQSVIQYE